MTMKKRIFISNTAIVLVSLLILFGTFGCIFGLFKKEYMEGAEQEDRLSEQKEYIRYMEKTEFTAEIVDVYNMDGLTAAGCIIMGNGTNYRVYALSNTSRRQFYMADSGMFEMFIIIFLITGLLAIAGLLLCSQEFTKMLIKKIMTPVEELSLAAKRINNGDLDTPIVYSGKDEFEEVCGTFNAMQEHLKDVTEKNAMYEKARTDMVAGISHDLRTPLTSVKAYIKGILDEVANTPEKQRKYLSIAYQKACDMEVLLQKLFFFSKLETGNMPFHMQKIEMGQWIEKYISGKRSELQEKMLCFCGGRYARDFCQYRLGTNETDF